MDFTLLYELIGAVFVVVVAIMLRSRLLKSRCAHCGKYFAAQVTSSERQVTVQSSNNEYDPSTREYGEVHHSASGYLVTRKCRFCERTWERLEST